MWFLLSYTSSHTHFILSHFHLFLQRHFHTLSFNAILSCMVFCLIVIVPPNRHIEFENDHLFAERLKVPFQYEYDV